MKVLPLYACVAMSAVAADISPAFVSVQPEVRSAYVSRGKVIEDRPMQTILSRVGTEVGPLGKVGFWNWDVSSLGNRRQNVHSRAFSEVDVGVFWHYDWEVVEGWTLSNDILKDWITLPHYHEPYRGRSAHSINEWRFEQSLENRYLTPYWLLRRGIHPNDWLYVRVGAWHRFPLTDSLDFRPCFYVENGDDRHFMRRYGARDGGDYRGGAQAVNCMLELSWKVSKNLSLFTYVHQFDIVQEDARRNIKNTKTTCARRDLTLFSIGLRCRF